MTKSFIIDFAWKTFDQRYYLRNINPTNSIFKFNEVTILPDIKSSKAAGIDSTPARIIKDIANEIAAPLTFLISISWQSGVFPTSEKIAKVIPIYKSGDRSNIVNYRPISVLNIISKSFERIFYNQLIDYLE